MRKAITLLGLLALIGSLAAPPIALSAPAEKYRVFVFTGGAPAYADKGVKAIKDLGKANGFGVQSNADPGMFTAAELARFRAVIFLDTTGSPLNAAQQVAFEAYFAAGGGFLGIGSTIELEPGLAVPDRRPGFPLAAGDRNQPDQPTARTDRDEQGRGPRPRRVEEPAGVPGTSPTGTTRTYVQRPRPQPTC